MYCTYWRSKLLTCTVTLAILYKYLLYILVEVIYLPVQCEYEPTNPRMYNNQVLHLLEVQYLYLPDTLQYIHSTIYHVQYLLTNT